MTHPTVLTDRMMKVFDAEYTRVDAGYEPARLTSQNEL